MNTVYNRMCFTWDFSYCLLEILSALNVLPINPLENTEGKKKKRKNLKYISEPWQHCVTQVEQTGYAQLESVSTTVLLLAQHLMAWICL